ncbi:ABC transporter ATP-binding protein [Ktedonosporobacter rubrisoli]|uniref:ABC transporter ATP-binding protein n=1 Tax=Ktedonosporobacter rubrisoli TaxID=2509675 RepID=A0A4P6K202_KTERU|nr:ABC transporter ATP-binding protein [Ktedonosporobacter rubrisoli]QBD81720.1 ABC transporter ATP-binding protein [Ktedonosporobacter rubrisoli]
MLKVDQLKVAYGQVRVLENVSLEVEEGEIVCLLGSNAAGKTTLLRTIMGLLRPQSGQLFYQQLPLNVSPFARVKRGIALVPEGRGVFTEMSVHENLLMGAYVRSQRAISSDLEHVYTLFPRLAERQRQPAATLSGGEQQMLAIGRALMARPRLLLLDEPSLGLAPAIVEKIFEIIKHIHREGTTILLVEQNVGLALSVGQRGYVLRKGQIVLSGSTEALLQDDSIRLAYLGRRKT